MNRRLERFGIGALAALLMVSMLAAPAAADPINLYTCGPDSGCPDGPWIGCYDEHGDILTGTWHGVSDIGMVILDVDKDGLDGFNASNPPYYLEGDDKFLVFESPGQWVWIATNGMGNGAFYGTVGPDVWGGEHIYVRLFNDVSIEESTYYGDSELTEFSVLQSTYRLENWNTTIEINWGTETFEKELESGWNLVSLPLTPDDNSTSEVLDSIATKYDSVMKYTPGTGFESVKTTVMDPGVGYFIYMNTNGTWSYDGDSYDSMTAPLSSGLNMAGWVNDDVALPGALNSIAGDYNYVARWNAISQDYEVYESDAPTSFNDFGTIAKGEGYFIAAKTGCTLTYP